MTLYLYATFAALASGPALYAVARPRPRVRRALGALVWIALSALLAVEVIPEALRAGGGWGFAWFAAGLAGPTALEQAVRRLRRQTHLAALAVALIGLGLHALADGAVLAAVRPETAGLGAAVALHSLPIGLTICWLVIPALGWGRAAAVLLAVCGATLLGFIATPDLEAALGPMAWAWFQMLVAGLLLHALLGRPHAHADDPPPPG